MSDRTLKVGGPLNASRHVYIERPVDREFFALLKAGEYVNLLAPRQMGKTSLMLRALNELRDCGARTASIDLAAELGSEPDQDRWFRGLLSRLAGDLTPSLDVGAWWTSNESETAAQKFQRFFRICVPAHISEASNVVVFLDEIDSTLKFPFTDGLFTAIRGMYNERSLFPAYERVTFCLIGVATPDELIKDRRTTSYNVGKTIALRDFNGDVDDLGPLAARISPDPARGTALLRRILYWTGGQPYLTQKLCAAVAAEDTESVESVDEVVARSFNTLEELREEVHFQQVLRFIKTRLTYGLDSLDLYEKVLRSEQVQAKTSLAYIELELSGLVKRDERGNFKARNRIYERLFDREWLQAEKKLHAVYRYKRRATVAAAGLAVALLGAAYLGYLYIGESQQVGQFESLSAQKIEVTGDPTSGYRLGFPRNTQQQAFEEAIRIVAQRGPVSEIRAQYTTIDVAPLAELQALSSLDLESTQIKDLSNLSRLLSLKRLRLRETNILSLQSILPLRDLEYLDLKETAISDFSQLGAFTKLDRLTLWNTKIASLEPIRPLTALRSLDIEGTLVRDLDPLSGLTNIALLYVSGTAVTDLQPLAGLKRLFVFSMAGTAVSDLSPLAALTRLHKLDASNSKVTDLRPLASLGSLEELNLAGTRIKNVEPLKGLVNLTTLNVQGTDVSEEDLAKLLAALAPPRGKLRDAGRGKP